MELVFHHTPLAPLPMITIRHNNQHKYAIFTPTPSPSLLPALHRNEQPNYGPNLRYASRSHSTGRLAESRGLTMSSRLSPFWQTKRGIALIGLVVLAVIGAVVGGVVGGRAARKTAKNRGPPSATTSPFHTQTTASSTTVASTISPS